MSRKGSRAIIAGLVLLLVLLSLIVALSDNFADRDLIRVACLGDSITQISGYPSYLQSLLGSKWLVGNFGASGATVSFETSKPYYFEPAFSRAKLFEPVSVIIMLGTNDARQDHYKQIDNFVADYIKIIQSIQELKTKPKIYLVKPPPIFNNTLNLNGTAFAEEILPRIEQVANTLGLHIIDVYTPLLNHQEYFPDGVHPNSEAAEIIAKIVYNALTS